MIHRGLTRNLFYLLLSLAFCVNSLAQTRRLDSLKLALKDCKSDTQGIKIRNEMCKVYAYSIPDTALKLCWESIKLARSGDPNGLSATTCFFAGTSCNNLGMRDSAEFYFNRAIQIAKRNKKPQAEAISYMGLGTCYNFWKKQDKALQNYMTSYQLFRSLGDSDRMAAVALGLGNVYSDLNNTAKALEFFNSALRFAEFKNNQGFMAKCYNNIGNLYQKNGTYEKALEYYAKSVEIKKAQGDEHGIANTYLNYGNIYTKTGKISLATFFYAKAKEGYAKIGDSAEYMNALNYIAECLMVEKKVPEALANLKTAEGICIRNHYTADLAGIYGGMTRVYIMLNDSGNARRSFENFSATKDSIISQDMNRQIAEMTAHFENDKQKQELSLKETELAASKKVNTVYVIATILFSVLLIVLLLVIFKLKKANALLQENARQQNSGK